MANIKSQKKRVLTNEKSHKRNVAVKSGRKTAIRATRKAIEAGDKAAAEAAYKVAAQKLDKAAGAGVIHKNQKAANRKSGCRQSTLCEPYANKAIRQVPAHHHGVRGLFRITMVQARFRLSAPSSPGRYTWLRVMPLARQCRI